MSVNIVVPAMGESVIDARIAKWLKNEGDAVVVGEPLVELETAGQSRGVGPVKHVAAPRRVGHNHTEGGQMAGFARPIGADVPAAFCTAGNHDRLAVAGP